MILYNFSKTSRRTRTDTLQKTSRWMLGSQFLQNFLVEHFYKRSMVLWSIFNFDYIMPPACLPAVFQHLCAFCLLSHLPWEHRFFSATGTLKLWTPMRKEPVARPFRASACLCQVACYARPTIFTKIVSRARSSGLCYWLLRRRNPVIRVISPWFHLWLIVGNSFFFNIFFFKQTAWRKIMNKWQTFLHQV